MSYLVTPNMSLLLAIPGEEPGPQYADDNNQSYTIIDSHNHSPGSGVQITPAGMDISTNLNFQNNSPYNVASVVFSSPSTNSGLTTLYTAPQSGGGIYDLYYNDGAGNVIALTKGGQVNATIASIPGESYSGGTFTWKQGSGSTTPANFDIGSITIRPNVAATTNGVVLNPPSSISSQYDVQLPIVPSVTSIMQLDTSGDMLATLVPDNSTIVISSQTLQVGIITGTNIAPGTINASILAPGTVTQNLLAPRSTGTIVPAGGVAVSPGSGAFSQSGGSQYSVPGTTVTITTTGRPVQLYFNAPLGSSGYLGITDDSGNAVSVRLSVSIYNNVTGLVCFYPIETDINPAPANSLGLIVPMSIISMLDMSVNGSAATYTYSVTGQNYVNGGFGIGTTTGSFINCYLIAYEI
jgi:hypothetical protein